MLYMLYNGGALLSSTIIAAEVREVCGVPASLTYIGQASYLMHAQAAIQYLHIPVLATAYSRKERNIRMLQQQHI